MGDPVMCRRCGGDTRDTVSLDRCLCPRDSIANLAMIRANLLDVLKVCGIEPAGVMTFTDDLLAVKRSVEGLQKTCAELATSRDGSR